MNVIILKGRVCIESYPPSCSRAKRFLFRHSNTLPTQLSLYRPLAPAQARACTPFPFLICQYARLFHTMSASDLRENCQSDVNGDADIGSHADYAEVIVVRHGETEWNSDGRIQGHLDVELNQVGKQQAAAVASKLSKEGKIHAVYSSDLRRASETALAIATACGGLEVVKDRELRERNLGDLQGLQLKQAANLKPLAYEAVLSNQTDQEIPGGGESIDQLYQRCTFALQKIARKHKGERVVVVTHGGVIRSLYRRSCPNRRFSKVLNTSVNIFHLSDGGNKWILQSWGDISHLDQTDFLDTGFGGDTKSG